MVGLCRILRYQRFSSHPPTLGRYLGGTPPIVLRLSESDERSIIGPSFLSRKDRQREQRPLWKPPPSMMSTEPNGCKSGQRCGGDAVGRSPGRVGGQNHPGGWESTASESLATTGEELVCFTLGSTHRPEPGLEAATTGGGCSRRFYATGHRFSTALRCAKVCRGSME